MYNTKQTVFRPEILEQFGAYAARFVGDSVQGTDLTPSVAFMRPSNATMRHWREEGLLTGGPQDDGSNMPWYLAF